MIRKRLALCVLGIGLAATLLTGCKGSQKSVNYNIDSNMGDTNSNSSKGNLKLSDLKNIGIWQEETEVELKNGSTLKVTIDSPVTATDSNEMNIYEGKYLSFDEKYKENLAKKVFGNEIYCYDEANRTKSDIEKIIEEKKAFITECQNWMNEASISEEERVSAEAEIKKYEDIIKECNENLPNASDSYKLANDFTGDMYLGYINGCEYILKFLNEPHDDKNDRDITRRISLYPKSITSIITESEASLENPVASVGFDYREGEDVGKYTEDEAVQMAKDYLSNMGFSDMEHMESRTLVWYGDDINGELIEDGYAIYFGQTYDSEQKLLSDDISTDGMDLNFNYNYTSNTYEQHTLVIINDKGVVMVDLQNPFEITNVTKDVGFVSFDTVKEAVMQEIQNRKALYSLYNGSISELKYTRAVLVNVRVSGDDDSVDYVPVWRLTEKNDAKLAIYVNATTGEIVDVNNIEQLYK